MSEVKWIKITTNMFEHDKLDFIESLPEADAIIVVWVKLLTLAGKCNANGFIFLTENIPYTEEMLAHKFKRPASVVRLALETFRRLEMIERIDGVVKIKNWEKYQNVDGLDKIREQNRKRVSNYRERQKQIPGNVTGNVTVTLRNDTDIDIDKEREKEKEKDTNMSVPYQKIADLYNDTCTSLSKVRAVSTQRQKHIKARWKQFDGDIDTFHECFTKTEASDFCKGKNDRGWKADFDWLIQNDSNMVKVLEGKYDNKQVKPMFTDIQM